MVFMLSGREQQQDMYNRDTTRQQQKSNNLNTSNSDNLIVTSDFPHSSVQNYGSYNTLISFKNLIYSQSNASINDEITDQINISEETQSRHNSE